MTCDPDCPPNAHTAKCDRRYHQQHPAITPPPAEPREGGDLGCYICDPFTPEANPEGCEDCDRRATEYHLERARRLEAVTTHTRESTPIGPNFCRDCSEAISDWVQWPCDGAAEPNPPSRATTGGDAAGEVSS